MLDGEFLNVPTSSKIILFNACVPKPGTGSSFPVTGHLAAEARGSENAPIEDATGGT